MNSIMWLEELRAEPEFLLPDQVERFSASSFGMFLRCPEQWRQRYVLGHKTRPDFNLAFGSAVHNAVGHNFEQKIESHEDLPVKEMVTFFHDAAVPEALAKQERDSEIDWGGKTKDDLHRDGEAVTLAYHGAAAPRVQPIGVEREHLIDVGVGRPILGYVDAETDDVVIDLKTSSRKVTQPSGTWELQGGIYHLMTGKPVHWHVATKTKTPAIYTPLEEPGLLQTPVAEMTIAKVRSLVGMISALMRNPGPGIDENGEEDPNVAWPPFGITTNSCGWCGVRAAGMCSWVR